MCGRLTRTTVLFSAVLLAGSFAPGAYGQGFGKIKKKVTLHRKLPAAVHLTGTAISVKVASSSARNPELAQQLSEILTAELLKNDQRLTVEPAHAQTLISCSITSFSAPPPQTVTRNVVAG